MKVQNMVPEVYYKESRDFSYIGRVLEVVLNHMKTNADLVNSNLNTVDSDDLLNSLAYTLGFKPKHKYINKDLANICSNFVTIMKNKGTTYAIEECVKILLNSQNIIGDYIILLDEDNCKLTIGLPSATQDIILLEDLFDYILPTGWIYEINNISRVEEHPDVFYFNESGLLNKNTVTANLGQVSRTPVSAEALPVGYEFIDNTTNIDNAYTENADIHIPRSQTFSGVIYDGTSAESEEEED